MTDEREGLPSASSADRFVHCAGSDQLIRAITIKSPPQIEEATGDGLIIHKALEVEDYAELTIEQAEIAEGLKKQRNALVESFAVGAPKVTEYREERMWVMIDGEKVFSAKPDLIEMKEGAALVINYKTGYIEATPAHISWQSRAEALAVWYEWRNPMKLKEVIVAVSQFRFGSKLSISRYTDEDLRMAAAQLKAAIWASRQPDAQRTPGHWCKWCPAKVACREHAAWCLLPSAIVAQGPLTLEDMKVIYNRRKPVEKLMEAVSAELRATSEEELLRVGLKLEENSPRRSIRSLNELAKLLEAQGLCDKEQLVDASKISVGAVESLVKDKVKLRLKAQGLKDTALAIKTLTSEIIQPVVEMSPVSKSVVEV